MAPEQSWDPDRYARNARFVADLGAPLLDLLNAQPGERILDLGCGDGALTRRIAELGVDVVGVDFSAEQVRAARDIGLDAHVMDGQALTFQSEFDAVFSNAALHWMKNPDAAIDGMRRALRPNGRVVAEMGGQGNVDTIFQALHTALAGRGLDGKAASPWYFPGPDDYRARLEKAGFTVRSIDLIPRPTPLPGEMADWLETFAEAFILHVPPADRAAFMDEVVETTRPRLYSKLDGWVADYVRLRFTADLVPNS